jgi:signal transduction histidine kinase/HPt (histidine-containing phosphotransfer) domain-containing protein/ActR/RegA family two-component response regulator
MASPEDACSSSPCANPPMTQIHTRLKAIVARLASVWARLSGFAWRPAMLQPATLLGAAMIVFTWIGLALLLTIEREKTLENATQKTNSLARQFEDYANGVLRGIDQALLFVRDAYQTDPIHFDLARLARQTQSIGGYTIQLSIIGADGFLLASTVGASDGHLYLEDREHFQAHLTTSADTLIIGRPVIGRESHKWSIQLSRRLTQLDGNFGGVIVASLDPAFIDKYFANVDLGPHAAATLRRRDLVVLSAHGLPNSILGQTNMSPTLRNALERTSAGAIWGAGTIDGINRVIAFKRSQEFPVIALVALSEGDLVAGYERHRPLYILSAAAITLVVLAIVVANARRQSRLARSEVLLREKSREQELTFDRMSQGLSMFDADGRLVMWNDRFARMYDLPPHLAQRGATFISIIEHHQRNGNFEGDRQKISQGQLERFTRCLRNGRKMSIVSTPVENGGWVATHEDITEFSAAKEAAEQSSKAKSDFLANMSHEIRTPMNGVLGMADLLRNTKLTSEQQDFVATIHRSAETLLQVINDILDFSKIEAGQLELENIPFSPLQVVLDVSALFTLVAQKKGVRLQTSGVQRQRRNDKDPIAVQGDPGRLRQILTNLVGNAVKFTSTGTITLAFACEPAGSEQLRLVFTVRDTGIGMSPDVLERLFSPFSQGDASTTRKFGGTGLGLSICKRLTGLMHGTIDVQSTIGIGTTFTVSIVLPVSKNIGESPADAQVRHEFPGETHVLIVEDNFTNQEVVAHMLTKLGVRYSVANNGLEAIEALRRLDYHIVFMDWQMSVMDGLEATRRIRQGEAGDHNRGIRIVAMTANAMSGDREKCLAAGMDDHLAKPISIKVLDKCLSRWILSETVEAPPLAPATEKADLPLFDEQEMLENFDNDRELVRRVVASALADLPNYLDSFERAVMRGEWEEAGRTAHAMKGVTSQIGGARLASQLMQIETSLRNGARVDSSVVAKVRREYDELKTALAS